MTSLFRVPAGFLPFSAIYIELYYLFASIWGHKVDIRVVSNTARTSASLLTAMLQHCQCPLRSCACTQQPMHLSASSQAWHLI